MTLVRATREFPEYPVCQDLLVIPANQDDLDNPALKEKLALSVRQEEPVSVVHMVKTVLKVKLETLAKLSLGFLETRVTLELLESLVLKVLRAKKESEVSKVKPKLALRALLDPMVFLVKMVAKDKLGRPVPPVNGANLERMVSMVRLDQRVTRVSKVKLARLDHQANQENLEKLESLAKMDEGGQRVNLATKVIRVTRVIPELKDHLGR